MSITPEQVFKYAKQHAPIYRPDITWADMLLIGTHSAGYDYITIKMLNTKTKEEILATVRY